MDSAEITLVPLTRCLDRSGFSKAYKMLCPVCQGQNQHFQQARNIPGKDSYAANWGGRGDLKVIPFWCEFGHEWELCFGEHKGEVAVFTRYHGTGEVSEWST